MSGRGQMDPTIYFKKYASIDLYINWFSIVMLEGKSTIRIQTITIIINILSVLSKSLVFSK